MVGQVKNLEKIKKLGFIPLYIISGDDMMGKYTLAKELCKIVDDTLQIHSLKKTIDETKVDGEKDDGIAELRSILALGNEDKAFCIIENFERFRLEAQSAMLKTFEETPNMCFIITVENMAILIDTIKTRGHIIQMEQYKKEEIGVENLLSPSEVEYWQGKKLNEYLLKMEEFTKTFITNNLIYSLLELKNLCSYKVDEDVPYYRFFIRFFDRNLIKLYKWQQYENYNKYIETRGTLFLGLNNSSNEGKFYLMDKYLRDLKRILEEDKK